MENFPGSPKYDANWTNDKTTYHSKFWRKNGKTILFKTIGTLHHTQTYITHQTCTLEKERHKMVIFLKTRTSYLNMSVHSCNSLLERQWKWKLQLSTETFQPIISQICYSNSRTVIWFIERSMKDSGRLAYKIVHFCSKKKF